VTPLAAARSSAVSDLVVLWRGMPSSSIIRRLAGSGAVPARRPGGHTGPLTTRRGWYTDLGK